MKNVIKNKIFWGILAITILGGFLRAYHFEDWMHYQLDQARDFRIIHSAIKYGPGELPLQGPRAAGSYLRLGPLLYYLEYGSALVFGDTPAGSIMIILILNILAIPLFYLFLREFFNKLLALGLSGIFSVSLFLVIYSRFGWNPTLVPFFSILFAYGLLKVTDNHSTKKQTVNWLMLSSFALALLINMHFMALVITPFIGIVYFIWLRPKIAFKYWLGAVLLFLFLNTPLIVNDLKTGGDNLREFFKVSFERGITQKDKHSLADKLVKNIGWQTQYYWITLTGDQKVGFPELKHWDITCGYNCRQGLTQGIISFFMVLSGLVAWWFFYFKEKLSAKKRNFLRLIALWGGTVFVIYTPLAYKLAPRFFLLSAPLAFVSLGLTLNLILKRQRKIDYILVSSLMLGYLLANLFFAQQYFNELSQASQHENFKLNYSDHILKEKTRITFRQMMMIADWMEDEYKKNNWPIFIYGQPEYKRAFWERIDVRDIPRDHIPKDLKPLYQEGNYFIIVRTQSNQENFLEKFLSCLNIKEKRNFGTLTAYQLSPKKECITAKSKIFKAKSRDPKFSKNVQVRYLWRQVFE